MKTRLVLLVAATTSLVVVAFLIPLAVLVRSSAEDRAIANAIVELESLVPLVTSANVATIELAIARVNEEGTHPVTVFLSDGRTLGVQVPRSAAARVAETGRTFTAAAEGGREILVAVAGLTGGTIVLRTLVGDAELRRGVGHAWTILGLLGLGLLAVSALVAFQLARTITRPLTGVAGVADQLAHGNLAARAEPGGPGEVRQVSAGLNRLADRIDHLLAAEREMVADLSHRLRTPLTALRIDAESLRDPEDRSRITADLDAVERTVNTLIHHARRPPSGTPGTYCDAAAVVADRARFWSALADEEQRRMEVRVTPGPVFARVGPDDLAAAVDALLGNVFAHTPEGTAMSIDLARLPGGGASITVADAGRGLPTEAAQRGHSGSGSTGLGLDIVRRVAAGSGGGVRLGTGPTGGAMITVELGGPPPRGRRGAP